jgi:hypothetical protein
MTRLIHSSVLEEEELCKPLGKCVSGESSALVGDTAQIVAVFILHGLGKL